MPQSIGEVNVPIIGLIGGVASGKTLVASELARLGAVVLDADRAGHEVLDEPEVIEALRQRWGEGVLDPAGRIERRAVGRIVFEPGERGRRELAFLEQTTHPRIGQRLLRQVSGMRAAGARAVVLDAPVMEKSGWYDLCDRIIYVDAPREIRLARARSRGWTEEDYGAREDAQESLEQKRSRADVIIDNSGSPQETREQVERWWQTQFPDRPGT